ncbi:MAG: recombination regulator RecX [Limnochordales bacterium]|nr:regulatory protein RecX [Limnochordales bacterium]
MRARSAAELEQRLVRRGFPQAVAAAVVEWCQGLGYVDDERFVEDWVQARGAGRPSGRRRLTQELLAKGIAPDLIRQKLEQLLPEEEERAHCLTLARAQYPRYKELPPEVRRRRLGGFLLRRGFPPEAVQWAIAQVDSDCERH